LAWEIKTMTPKEKNIPDYSRLDFGALDYGKTYEVIVKVKRLVSYC
jgi:hypothetical protein